MDNIRNFVIIAHIDHGKSTLADRFLELTGTIEKRKMKEQFLDQMDLERERGITIKLQPIRMNYKLNNESYKFNLIDTPGHIDFNYEVSRSLAAVEGAVLLVDAVKGIQAQTLTNLQLALNQHLVIIPVINKIDLPGARIAEVEQEIKNVLGGALQDKEILKISAKKGTNVELVLESVIKNVPRPAMKSEAPLRALIFDSFYDNYKGIIAYVRIIDGQVKQGDKLFMMASKTPFEVLETGIFTPQLLSQKQLSAGQIGYIATGLKETGQCRVGDTIVLTNYRSLEPLSGYQESKPMVFASFYPTEGRDFDFLKDALSKLKLNDASFVYEIESSSVLGRGFKCGFLGMLHLEIVTERLKREYDLDLVVTTPSVTYQLLTKEEAKLRKKPRLIYAANELPEPNQIESAAEPWVKLEIITSNNYLGPVNQLLQGIEGRYLDTQYLSQENILIIFEAPLREIIVDFYDDLKSVSSGYASLSYEFLEFRSADLVKLDILIANEKVEAFSRIVPKDKAYGEGRALVRKLKKAVPPQLFAIALQASVGGKIIARETISALKKDVIGYLYGGDYSRKRKLLEKQKKGKKKMKALGKVKLPQEVFLAVLKKQRR